ncbi:MAG TPA: sigma-70 family RNA polymerase sigma factor [Solirubrobacteraceae bacterium]|nr:sigma-70 family RNA polymerase sigma factor [Solirubrobacteraceae bacterium]
MTPDARTAVAEAFTEEWGRVVATLIGRTGDWDLAEDCAQQAFAEAVRRWPRDGVPDRPGAWLTTVARNRATDRLRHEQMKTRKLREASDMAARHAPGDDDPAAEPDDSGIEDERLRLMFTCCHPALPLEGRVALTLRALAGLTTAEIAHAFFVSEPTMAKRLVRAKGKIIHAGIPYRVPPAHLLPERTSGVLAVLYLLFNEGYAASAGDHLIRIDLCGEAIRLARALTALMPDEPEATGLLALMLFQHSRRLARVDAAGDLVTLENQDRARWNRAECDEAEVLLQGALRRRQAGPYQLQAAIAACHAGAPTAEATDWAQIAGLYERLLEVMPQALVRLNHAVAIGMATSPEQGLALADELVAAGELADYHLLYATRADLLRRLGRDAEAHAAYRDALQRTTSAAERRFLNRRIQETDGRR